MNEPDLILALDLVLFSIGTDLKLERYPSGGYHAVAKIGTRTKSDGFPIPRIAEGFGQRPWIAIHEALIDSGSDRPELRV